MTLVTRRPTGLPSWPMILLAGREGSGKSYSAATATASPLIERSFWIGIGEDDPDEYGAIAGADFDIVEHDGTVADIIRAIRDVATAPKAEKPYLMVVDSMTKMWDLVVDNAQAIANQRARGRKNANGDYSISPDLWNVAANQWKAFMDAIRLHRGPSILTARLDEVMVMNDEGQPTKDKRWKVQAHKSLVYDVAVIVEMHERGQYLLTKTKSLRLQLEKPTEAPDFTVGALWQRLGLEEAAIGERTFQGTVTDDPSVEAAVDAWKARAEAETTKEGIQSVWDEARTLSLPNEVFDAIRAVAAEFKAKETQTPELDGTKPGKEQPRDWASEVKGLEFAEDAQALWNEAVALSAPKKVVDQLAGLAGTLKERPAPVAPDSAWAPVAEESPSEEVPVSEGQAAVLADEEPI